MIRLETTVHIDRPPQEVFEFVSDPANDPLYRSGAASAEWSSEGPVGVGSTMRSLDRVIGRDVETTSEITFWNPPEAYAFRTVNGSFPARFAMEFESVHDGTQLTSRGDIEFRGPLKVVEWLFGKRIKNQFEGDFQTLKLLLEDR